VLAYGSVWDSGAVAALQEWSVRVVMTGGLLQIVAFGAGALSIDNRRQKRERKQCATALIKRPGMTSFAPQAEGKGPITHLRSARPTRKRHASGQASNPRSIGCGLFNGNGRWSASR
jgi:hypothetical protein